MGTEEIKVRLRYSDGQDEPARGIFRRLVIEPEHSSELLIAIRSDEDPQIGWHDLTGDRPQIHLVGTARALEEFGTCLIALARLESADPEPYASLEDVQNSDGGTVRLMPRRRRE